MIAFNSTFFLSYRLLCVYENISIVYAQYKFYIYYCYLLLSLWADGTHCNDLLEWTPNNSFPVFNCRTHELLRIADVHTNPEIAYFFTPIGLRSHVNQWIRSPKPHCFETAFQSRLSSRPHSLLRCDSQPLLGSSRNIPRSVAWRP